MKTRIFVPCVVLAMICSSWTIRENTVSLSGQASSLKTKPVISFAFFRVHKQAVNGVTATWGLESSVGVTSFALQRTYEDPTDPYSPWDDIAVMNVGNGKNLKYTDSNLSPGLISYRVQCLNGTTVVATSEVITYDNLH
jgi:hypothetical protein